MTEYTAALAPAKLPDILYTRVDREQAAYIESAMKLPENRASFDVSFLPLNTPEVRRAAAEEWAAYEQAKAQVEARERGAFLVLTSRDYSSDAFLALLEDEDNIPEIPFAPFVTHALLKAVKLTDDADTYQLVRDYYDSPK